MKRKPIFDDFYKLSNIGFLFFNQSQVVHSIKEVRLASGNLKVVQLKKSGGCMDYVK